MEQPSPEDRIGSLLGGRYRLESLVARGGMAAVYRGRHEVTGRLVAVKVLDDALRADPEALQRFLLEGRLASQSAHPNVAEVLDVGDGAGGGCAFVVLELLEGETLGDVLDREGPLPPGAAAALLVPAMAGVARAHARGVVHRDLKPDNLFLHRGAGGALVPKVVDFGVARDLAASDDGERITRVGEVVGTPAYMSPEQACGESDRAGAAADVWSMGVVWYEALAGALPFDGPTPAATMAAVACGPYVPLAEAAPWVPAALAEVVDRALARDPGGRHADMGAFLDAVLAALREAEAAGDVEVCAPVVEGIDVAAIERPTFPFALRRPRARKATRSMVPGEPRAA
ncbi:MAG: serine/threonine-protein kinase [Polyangiales bacterium]